MEFLDQTGELDNLWTACSNGDLNRVKHLLESGENKVDDQDEYGYSPMHAAVSYGHMDLLQYLVEVARANIRLRDMDGDEPIHVCEEPRIFEYLVEHGADPTAKNNDDEDIFHKSIEDENEEMVNYLISIGIGQASDRLPQFRFENDEGEGGEDGQELETHMEDENGGEVDD
jgi:uncharacterized protein